MWFTSRLATYTAEVNERVNSKKCFRSALDELNIMPMKVMVLSGGLSRAMLEPSWRMSYGAAKMERPLPAPPCTPPGESGW